MEKYDNYKDSGIEWIGKIPSHWGVVPIKYSLAIPLTDGPHETPEFISDGIPFISAESIKEDKIDFEKKRGNISLENHQRYSNKYKPKIGDIYMIKSGATTGNLARVETDIEFNIWSPLAAFRPNLEKTTTDFLFFYMKSSRFFSAIELGWNYGTQQNIGMNVLENLKIVRPTLPEQTTIANYLDRKTTEIDELIADKKRLLELYEEEKTAIINQAVTKGINPDVPMKDSGIEWLGVIPEHWEVKKIKHLTKLQGGYAFKSDLFSNEGTPIIRIGDISTNINFDECKKIDDDTIPKEYWLDQYDTLIALSGATTGKTCFVNNIPLKAYINQRVARIMFSNKFLYYIVNSSFFQEQILLTASGSAQQNISNSQIENLEISISPTPEEQTAIVHHIETECNLIDAKKAKTEKLIDLLTEYRTALISEVVTGKIKVTE